MKFISVYLLVLVLFQQAFSQHEPPFSRSVATPSPQAVALAKYGDSPASLSYGTADITLPVCVAAGRSLSVPISLRYHASGRKVDELSTWVGYGWSLHAGGVISRVMRGLPDEGAKGFLSYAGNIPDQTDPLDPALEYDLANDLADMVPDLFYFNVGTVSGKFMFGNDGQPHVIPGSDFKITSDIQGTNTFTLTTSDGTTYKFGGSATERSSVTRTPGRSIPSYTSTWYLTEVISYDKTDTISFIYDTVSDFIFPADTRKTILQFYNVPANSSYHYNYEADQVSENFIHQVSNVQRLKEIETSRGKVVFSTLPTTLGHSDVKLDHITTYVSDPVLNQYSTEKTINFTYAAYASSDTGAGRLKLTGFGESGLPGYTFTYDPKPVPSYGSYSQDHWGYYNGATNSSLLPETTISGKVLAAGNSREPDASYMDAGILTMITSPLGGETHYAYEPHDYWDESASQDKMAGGLRIRQVIARDPFSNINDVTTYAYKTPETGNSSGVLLSPYGYLTVLPVKENGVEPYGCNVLSAPHSYMGLVSGGPVGYSSVKIYKGPDITTAGYTLQQYNMPEDEGTMEFPFVPFNDKSWTRGQLLSVKQYKYVDATTTQLVMESGNNYENNNDYLEIKGLKVSASEITLDYVNPSPLYLARNYVSGTGFPYLSSTTVTTYDPGNGTSLVQTSGSHFDSGTGHHQLLSHQTTNSEGTIVETTYQYPPQYPSSGVMAKMQAQHIIGLPVESRQWIIKNNTRYLTGYTKTTFTSIAENGYERIYPEAVYTGKITDPVAESTFNNNPGDYLKKQQSYTYDDYGNVLTVTDETGGRSVNIYEKKGHRQIATVQHATAGQVAHTSFEANDFGNWEVEEQDSEETLSATLGVGNNAIAFTSTQSQTLSIAYTITRSSGNLPSLRFTPASGAAITETLVLSSGTLNVPLTPGYWLVEFIYADNVSAAQINFDYSYWVDRSLDRELNNSRTGRHSLNLTDKTSIKKNNLPAGQYTLTYWTNQSTPTVSVTNGSVISQSATGEVAGNWELQSSTIAITTSGGIITISGQGLIDEIRLIPETAVIHTIAHNQYDQPTDQTDHNHRSVYYEYDAHHRLIIVRDHDKNILQQKTYGFASN